MTSCSRPASTSRRHGLLAKHWGLEFEHVPTTGASRIPALQTGKADLVISSLSYTTERAKVIDFSLGYAVLRNCHRRAARPLGLSSGPTVPAFDARFAFLRSTDVELECC